jgi:hypothetical protein
MLTSISDFTKEFPIIFQDLPPDNGFEMCSAGYFLHLTLPLLPVFAPLSCQPRKGVTVRSVLDTL